MASIPARRRTLWLAASLAAGAVVAALLLAGGGDRRGGPAPTTPSVRVGIADEVFSAPPAERRMWLRRAHAAGARVVRIAASWAQIEPQPGAFDWRSVDGPVSDARALGLDVIVTFVGAPAWAEGPGRPAGAPEGSWRPSPSAFGAFGHAAAARYLGGKPGAVALQAWNEPNLGRNLSPQWDDGRPAAGPWYRRMLTAFADGVHAARPHGLVVAGGLAPFGDHRVGGDRTSPLPFLRQVLCPQRPCRVPAVGAVDHHPYAVGPPEQRARNADDATIADLGRVRRALDAIDPRLRLWVTELSYDGRPPDPDGVPEATRTRWLTRAFGLLERAGVDTILWYLIRDQDPLVADGGYAGTYQSGLYTRDGRPKAALAAYRRVADGLTGSAGTTPPG